MGILEKWFSDGLFFKFLKYLGLIGLETVHWSFFLDMNEMPRFTLLMLVHLLSI